VGPLATVLIPTFDNGESIRRSIDSALAQTVQDFELFVVGDGAVEVTRQIVTEKASGDSRIRFFDNPKGPGHGEIHRHAALQHATGEIVAYLADDDLWLPNHLELLRSLLADADFAHASAVLIGPGDALGRLVVDLTDPEDLAVERQTKNRIAPTMAGHTLAAYRRLPHGWRTAPAGSATDWWMWRQFLDQPGLRLASDPTVTALIFPNPLWRSALPVLQMLATEAWLRRRERQLAALSSYTDRLTSAPWFRALRQLADPLRSIGGRRTGRAASRIAEQPRRGETAAPP
jgi:hypothetical protein